MTIPNTSFRLCSEPGCHAKVMASGPHEKCQRHRTPPPTRPQGRPPKLPKGERETRQAIHDTVQRMRERAGH